jgi:hypothetical protein
MELTLSIKVWSGPTLRAELCPPFLAALPLALAFGALTAFSGFGAPLVERGAREREPVHDDQPNADQNASLGRLVCRAGAINQDNRNTFNLMICRLLVRHSGRGRPSTSTDTESLELSGTHAVEARRHRYLHHCSSRSTPSSAAGEPPTKYPPAATARRMQVTTNTHAGQCRHSHKTMSQQLRHATKFDICRRLLGPGHRWPVCLPKEPRCNEGGNLAKPASRPHKRKMQSRIVAHLSNMNIGEAGMTSPKQPTVNNMPMPRFINFMKSSSGRAPGTPAVPSCRVPTCRIGHSTRQRERSGGRRVSCGGMYTSSMLSIGILSSTSSSSGSSKS